MKWLAQLVAAAALLTTPLAISAQSLTEAQARGVIAPWYGLFNQPSRRMKTLQEQVLTGDYESCWGYLTGECWAVMLRSKWRRLCQIHPRHEVRRQGSHRRRGSCNRTR